LDCLKYARENGCRWDWKTCAYAVYGGRLSILVYAHENGCPWNESICEEAAILGNLDCLKYARENGCPWNAQACLAKTKSKECREYILENITGPKQYDTSMDTKSDDDECTVCYENKNKVQFKPCNHYLCIACNNRLIQLNMADRCYMCRQPVKENCLI